MASDKPQTTEQKLRSFLIGWLADTLEVAAADIDPEQPFQRQGLDSLQATRMVEVLAERLGRDVSPVVVWGHPTVEALSRHLAGTVVAPAAVTADPWAPSAATGDARGAGGTRPDPIAIVGMACRMPGGAANLDAFWQLLCDGVDAVRKVPADRWDADAVYHPDPLHRGGVNTREGGFIDRIDLFDPLFFGISPREAEQMDPQQRLLLEVAWEALEDAGQPAPGLAGSKTGVFIGASWQEYALEHRRLNAEYTSHTGVGQSLNIMANRISYLFGLQGPSLVVDTACSSSLVSVHLACQSLRDGEAEMALAGGVNLILSLHSARLLTKFGGLSGDGRCKSFDHRADGFGRGEGAGMVLLKPLSRALEDGDRIYCLIRGSATNNDGPSNGLTAPNPEAQIEVLRAAYRRAGVEPSSVGYVETHGTGTALGDPIEAQALSTVLCADREPERPLRLGAVKSNLGHLETAAGIAGLIKAALVVHHRAMPGNLHFQRPNPHIPFDDWKLRVQTSLEPWPTRDLARVGVSSFGWGGSNCHMVLEEAPVSRACLLPLAASGTAELRRRAQNWRDFLDTPASHGSLPQLCRAAGVAASATSESAQTRRLAVVGSTRAELQARLDAWLQQGATPPGPTAPGKGLVFVLSPGGSAFGGLGDQLLREEPVFRATFQRCTRIYRQISGGRDLLRTMTTAPDDERWDSGAFAGPILTSFQIAMMELWRSWGVEPDAVVGHSIGEIAAAYAAGALDLRQAMTVLYAYQVSLHACAPGTMSVVQLSAAQVEPMLEGREAWLSGELSPNSCVVSGPDAALAAFLAELPGEVFRARVKVNVLVHTPPMRDALDAAREVLQGLEPSRARIPLYSTYRSDMLDGSELTADHWLGQLGSPPRLAPILAKLLDDGYRYWLQIDPHPVLGPVLRQNFAAAGTTDARALVSMRRGDDVRTTMLESLARLYEAGLAHPRWQRIFPAAVGGVLPSVLAENQPDAGGAQVRAELLVLSARSPEALRQSAADTAARLRRQSDELSDICYSAAVRRPHHEHRLALTGTSHAALAQELDAWVAGTPLPGIAVGRVSKPRLAFLFSGQGARWSSLDPRLVQRLPVLRDALVDIDRRLRALGVPVLETLFADDAEEALRSTALAQPAIFALQVALVEQWRAWGIEPAAVLGHSVGEIAAAWAAGALSLDDAARLVVVRGAAMDAERGRGAMAAVELDEAEALEVCAPYGERLSVAAINAPRSVVLSGEPEALTEVLLTLESQRVRVRRLAVDYAFHAAGMEAAAARVGVEMEAQLRQSGSCSFVSSVTGQALAGEELTADYWSRNVRQPVRFAAAVEHLADPDQGGFDLFVEIGPHPVLAVPTGEVLAARAGEASLPPAVLPSLRRGRDGREVLLQALAQLYARGCEVHWPGVFPDEGRLVKLPGYAFQRRSYWLTSEELSADGAAPTVQERAVGLPEPQTSRVQLASQPPSVPSAITSPDAPLAPAGVAAAETEAVLASQLQAFQRMVHEQLQTLEAEALR